MSGGKYFHTHVRNIDVHTLLCKCVDEFIVWKVKILSGARCLLSFFFVFINVDYLPFTLALLGSVGEFDNMEVRVSKYLCCVRYHELPNFM